MMMVKIYLTILVKSNINNYNAGVAQLVAQLTCNEKVEGSSPFSGTTETRNNDLLNRQKTTFNLSTLFNRQPTQDG